MELKGAKINFLGDSITEGRGTSEHSACFTEVMLRDCQLAVSRNYGIGGTRIARQQSPSEAPSIDQDFCLRCEEIDADADAVVVFGGTNDYGHGDAPFGTSADNTTDSFCGACNVLFSRLKARFPEAKILIITPLHRLNDTSTQGDGRPQAPRPALQEYVEAIKEATNRHGLGLLNFFDDHTLDANDPSIQATYVPDGLHPNDAGHQILAQRIAAALETM